MSRRAKLARRSAQSIHGGARLTVAIPADFQVFASRVSDLAYFLVGVFLSLVRPALAAGDRHPWRSGARAALDAPSALLAMSALMRVPPMIFGLLVISLVRRLFGVSPFLHVVNDLLVVTFSVFQYLAFEASTALFFGDAAAAARKS